MTLSLNPFADLSGWMLVFYLVALVVVVVALTWTAVLFVASRRALRDAPGPADPDEYLWVFFMPALDEEVTIADSVARLLAVECANRLILVIDDGSTDRTPEVLAAIDHPDLAVLRRFPPDARNGKAVALNAGWNHLRTVLSSGRWAGWGRDRVVVVIVDADGRLDPHSPRYVAGRLTDPRVGGVQLLVRIYNRRHPLAWLQDVEFGIFGMLFQAGRAHPGTAGMGGNGQCHRLTALDDLALPEAGGPWRNTLTEDQDLGLRMIEAGWHGIQETRATVSQQGVPNLRRLLRQRTRWAQGNLQVMSHLPAIGRLDRSWLARLDLYGYLLLPVIQALLMLTWLLTVVFLIFDVGGFRSDITVMGLVTFYVLGLGSVILGCIAWGAQRGAAGAVFGWLVAHVYFFYMYLVWPVLLRAAYRQVVRRQEWEKTAREPVPEAWEAGAST